VPSVPEILKAITFLQIFASFHNGSDQILHEINRLGDKFFDLKIKNQNKQSEITDFFSKI